MSETPEKVMTLHPEGKQGVNIERAKYDDMKAALLQVAGADEEGVPFSDLPTLVAPLLSEEVWGEASVMWYVVTIKLDLEARGLLERVPGSRPQRVRRGSG